MPTSEERKRQSQLLFFRPTERFMKKLASHISIARRKRRLTQAQLAERSLLSISTYRRIEKGDSSVSVAALMRVLFLLDGLKSFDDLLSPETDALGRELLEDDMPKRIRPKKNDYLVKLSQSDEL